MTSIQDERRLKRAKGYWYWCVEDEWDGESDEDGWKEIDFATFKAEHFYNNPSLVAPDETFVISCGEYSVFDEDVPRPKLQEMMKRLNRGLKVTK